MTIGKWRIVGTLIIAAGLAAALPFQRTSEQPSSRPNRSQESDFVWRRPEAGPELEAQIRRSPAEELFIRELTAEEPSSEAPFPQVSRPALLDSSSPPPQLSADYEPLLEPLTEAVANRQNNTFRAGPESYEVESHVVRHRIVDGDTLARLAARYLESEDRWQDIYEENRDVLESPELLPIGQELMIVVRKIEAAGKQVEESKSGKS